MIFSPRLSPTILPLAAVNAVASGKWPCCCFRAFVRSIWKPPTWPAASSPGRTGPPLALKMVGGWLFKCRQFYHVLPENENQHGATKMSSQKFVGLWVARFWAVAHCSWYRVCWLCRWNCVYNCIYLCLFSKSWKCCLNTEFEFEVVTKDDWPLFVSFGPSCCATIELYQALCKKQ